MSKIDFSIQTHEEYVSEVLGLIKSGSATEAIIMSMNLFARPNSLYDKLAQAMIVAKKSGQGKFEIRYDKNYADSHVVLPDGHYAFLISWWDPQNWHKKIEPYKVSKHNQKDYADVLVNSPSRFFNIPTSGNWTRKLFSLHLLQGYAANHAKSGIVKLKNGDEMASLLNGELVSGVEQNNLVLSIKNNPMATTFVEKATNPNTEISSRGWTEEEIFPGGRLVIDYGNYGEPSQLSRIHDLAEMVINPLHSTDSIGGEPPKHRPTNIILVTQYAPYGRLLETLRLASIPKSQGGYGARVIVPLEPDGNYRRQDPGFALLNRIFMKRKGEHLKAPVLKYPTHVKCLLARYDDGSASMIFGSDNFDSISDSFYRNTEINLFIDRANPGEDSYKIIEQMLAKLVEIGDISVSEKEKFLKC